nr:reverse transcriptase domain-containing protein [Tanacetum cinerariifolium]
MRTRSSSNLIVEPITIPKRQNRRRPQQIVEPELPTIVENPVVTMADQRTMAELHQAPTKGYEDAIVVLAILAENFELKRGLLILITSKQFYGHDKEDPHAYIRWFNKITSTMRFQNVPNTSIKLMLFLFSIEGAARIWLEKKPPRTILTWEDLVSKFINQFFPPSKMTNLLNEITRFQQHFDETFYEAWDRFKDLLRACLHHGFTKLHQLDTFYNDLNPTDRDSLNAGVSKNTSSTNITQFPEVVALIDVVKDLIRQNKTPTPASVKAVEEIYVTCGGPHPYYNCTATDGNIFKDNIQEYVSAAVVRYNQGNTEFRPQNMMASYFQTNIASDSSSGSGSLPSNTVANPRDELKAITTGSGISYDGPIIPPTTSLPPKEVVREPEVTKDKVQPTRLESTAHVQPLVVQVPFQEPDVSPKTIPKSSIPYPFADALIPIPKFASIFKSLLSNKGKLFELANTPLNENCSAVLLKKLPEKLEDPGEFLIPCYFPDINACLALADLGASINLMPLSVWKKRSLPKLTTTRMTLKLANYYEVDPRFPLILGRPFLRTARALIDVYGEELTLRVNDEAITFKVGQTSSYSHKYEEPVHQIDVIDVACEKYIQEVLGFSDSLMRIRDLLSTPDELSNCDDDYYDTEGDILYLEQLLNEDPSLNPFSMKNEDLKQVDVAITKPSIKEPSELELKDLPPYLEYAFLEETNKLPVIISK